MSVLIQGGQILNSISAALLTWQGLNSILKPLQQILTNGRGVGEQKQQEEELQTWSPWLLESTRCGNLSLEHTASHGLLQEPAVGSSALLY